LCPQDPKGTLQYGLIAEEVEQVYPELVIRDDDGKEIGVRYDLLPTLLLNELQRLVKKDQQKDARIVALERQIGMLQKETRRIDMLAARLNALEDRTRAARPESLAVATR
jgi:hypothetical protein